MVHKTKKKVDEYMPIIFLTVQCTWTNLKCKQAEANDDTALEVIEAAEAIVVVDNSFWMGISLGLDLWLIIFYPAMFWLLAVLIYFFLSNGRLTSKAIYSLLTSPPKKTDEFALFAFLLFTENKSNQILSFFGRS